MQAPRAFSITESVGDRRRSALILAESRSRRPVMPSRRALMLRTIALQLPSVSLSSGLPERAFRREGTT